MQADENLSKWHNWHNQTTPYFNMICTFSSKRTPTTQIVIAPCLHTEAAKLPSQRSKHILRHEYVGSHSDSMCGASIHRASRGCLDICHGTLPQNSPLHSEPFNVSLGTLVQFLAYGSKVIKIKTPVSHPNQILSSLLKHVCLKVSV